MPLQATSGAASYDAFGGGVVAEPNYIESVFSTYLYTGNGSTQTITNGIDLSTKGGLVWIKNRGSAELHQWWTTLLGNTSYLRSNGDEALFNSGSAAITYNTTNFSLNTGSSANNANANTYVSWTFRKQPKFFDVVTYTGTGSNTTIAHSLGSVPGSIIVKRTDTTADWAVYHRSLANTEYLVLNSTAAKATGATWWNSTTPTSAVFSVGTDASVNASGATYVAYLFAHDAGGFGTAGTDNVISCGSFTTDASGDASVTLGYEPQWILYKKSSGVGNWVIADNMRGWNNSSISRLFPDDASAEVNYTATTPNAPTATGFISTGLLSASSTFIYIAIRRGPMKVPTLGTSVLNITTSVGTNPAYVSSFPVDFAYRRQITGTSDNYFHTRLQGAKTLYPNYDVAEDDDANVTWDYQNGMFTSTGANANQYGWLMRRAPSFMDIVCYTGNSTSGATQTHNLGVVPELMIVKRRNTATDWYVYSAAVGATKFTVLNSTAAPVTATNAWNNTAPTSAVFTLGTAGEVNNSAGTYVAYLFASCAGVSKVGSYTGNGTTQTIDCGFTGGARFVIIKRTDSTGGWYVYDTVRGMTVLTDPYVFLNSNAVQVATLGSVTTVSTGFALNSTILAAINVNAGSYIFLAIA